MHNQFLFFYLRGSTATCSLFFFLSSSEAGWCRQEDRRLLAMPLCKVLILSIALASFYTELYISSVVAKHCRRPVEILHTGPALHRRANCSFLFKSACSFNGTVCVLYCYLLQGCCIAVAKEKKKNVWWCMWFTYGYFQGIKNVTATYQKVTNKRWSLMTALLQLLFIALCWCDGCSVRYLLDLGMLLPHRRAQCMLLVFEALKNIGSVA